MTKQKVVPRGGGFRLFTICFVLLVIILAIIAGAWYWLLLSVPLLFVTFLVSMWSDTRSQPSALLKALKAFFVYTSFGMLLIGLECAVFRDIDLYDSQVHRYEEHVGLAAECIEQRLSLSFKALFAGTAILIGMDWAWNLKLMKGFSAIRSMIGKTAVVFAVLTSFTFLNVSMIEGLTPGWLKKRTTEINKDIDDLGKKRRHELRLALVKEKVEAMTSEDAVTIALLIKTSQDTRAGQWLLTSLAADQGDDLENLVVKDRRYNDQKPWSDTLPMEFSFQELNRLRAEDKEIAAKNERDHKAILELFKKGFSSLLPEELQPVLKEFADALIDGTIDTTDEAVFPQRITGQERFSALDLRWHLDKPPAQLLADESTAIDAKEVARTEARAAALKRWDEEREAWRRWVEASKRMGDDPDHPERGLQGKRGVPVADRTKGYIVGRDLERFCPERNIGVSKG